MPDKMSRLMSLSWGASASQPSRDKNMKKRTLPTPTSPAATKRQKSGPFIIDSDEDSDGDRGNDDGPVENDGSETLVTPTGSVRNRLQSPLAKDDGMIAPGAILQQQASNGSECLTFGSKPVTASQPGKERNNDRFKMMMARKQGGTVARGSEQRPLQTGLRSRPMNITHASNLWQEKPLSFTADDDSLQLDGPQRGTSYLGPRGVRQQRDTPRCSSSAHASADARSNPSSGTVGRSLFEVEYPYQTHIGRPQKPANEEYPQLATAEARTRQPPTSRAPNSSVSRKTETPRWKTPPNSCSLRNILDVAKAEDNGAAQKQNSVGSEWRRAQSQRASMVSARKVPKPEVGARYGHTLTAKKMSAAEKAPVDTKSARGFRDDQIPVARDSNSPGVSVEGTSSRATFPPNAIVPAKRKPTPQSIQPARQKTVPRLVSQGSPKMASGSSELSAPPNPTKETVNSSPLEETPRRPERMSNVSSPTDALFSEVECTTGEITMKPQSPSLLEPTTQPRSSVGLLSDVMVRDITLQNEATDTSKLSDTGYKVPISHEFEVCEPRFPSYESAVRTNVPVAVMVRPKQGLSGPFLAG
ncbi:hypothetical protein C7974DRAFT_204230 [Boeremia exigua]|uniref:uncharacterized protein n=1 Tax=Boeremia exigua TaxID=749465 RepID=UPI001E8E17BE|nr:uncharacterized protein C7974DRAFT_204230 [Boeremia exigua]KAH6625632.1 hypothetical protein C7974DRAFT_204230 [Boeremia exigua]